MSQDLGFGNAQPSLDVSDFKPKPPAKKTADKEAQAADKVAARNGFASRESTERVVRVRKEKAPTDYVYVRGSLELINRFKRHCNDAGLSYGAALEALMDEAGKDN